MARSCARWLVPVLLLSACGRDLALPAIPGAPDAPLPLSVSPAPGLAAPGETITLSITGGVEPIALVQPEGPPVEASTTLPSLAVVALEGRTLTYTAPTEGDFDDEIPLVDAAGTGVTARIRVGAVLRIVPGYSIANASGRADLEAVGGKAPYDFVVADDEAAAAGAASSWLPEEPASCSGDAEPPVTGQRGGGRLLLASTAGRSTVTLTDATGATDTATIVRGLGLRVIPAEVELAPGEEQNFELLGGDPPYVLTLDGEGVVALPLPADGSAALPAGLSWNGSGLTVAPDYRGSGEAGVVAFTITVRDWSALAGCARTDDAARSVTARVRIVVPPLPAPLALDAPASLGAGRSRQLLASGGVPPYSFGYEPRRNFSGGSVEPGGAYTAGPNANLADVVRVVDAAGSSVSQPVFIQASGVPASEWRAELSPRAGADLTHPEAVGRTLFAGGLRFSLGADGELRVGPGAPGYLSQVTDFNDDELPDVLVRLGEENGGRLHLYVGTPGGDLVWAGGGIQSLAAAVVPTSLRRFLPQGGSELVAGPRWVVLARTNDAALVPCDLAVVSLGDFLSGTPPASCAVPYDPARGGTSAYLVPTGPGGVALVRGGIEFFQLDPTGGLQPAIGTDGLPLACPPDRGDESFGAPVAVDLDGDGDGRGDVVRVVRAAGSWSVESCVVSSSLPATSLRLELPAPLTPSVFAGARRPGARDEVIVGPTLDEGGTSVFRLALRGEPGGALLELSSLPIPPGSLVGSGDLDGDGFVDVASVGSFEALLLHRGDPDGGLGRSIRVRLGPPGRYEIQATRLDRDGSEDLVAATSGYVRLLGGAAVPSDPANPASPPLPALVTFDESADGALSALAGVLDADGDGDADLLGVDGSLELRLLTTDGETGAIDGELTVNAVSEPTWGRPRGVQLLAGGPEQLVVPILREQRALVGLELFALDPATGSLSISRSVPVATASADGSHTLLVDADGDGITDLLASATCGTPCSSTRVEGLFLWRGREEGGSWSVADEPVQLAGPIGLLPGFDFVSQPVILLDPARRLVIRLVDLRYTGVGQDEPAVGLDAIPLDGGPATAGQVAPAGSLAVSVDASHVALRDLDGDGLPELLLAASTSPDEAENALAVLSLDASGLPLPGELRCAILAPAGVTASWQPIDVLGDGSPELAVSLTPPGQSSAPEVVLLRSSWSPAQATWDPFGCAGSPFAP